MNYTRFTFLISLVLILSFGKAERLLAQNSIELKNDLSTLREDPFYHKAMAALAADKPEKVWQYAAMADQPLKMLLADELQHYYLGKQQYRLALKAGRFIKPGKTSFDQYLCGNVLFNSGMAYDYEGQPDSSLLFHQQALNIRHQLLGSGHIATATSHGYLGFLYRYKKNDLIRAEHHYRQQLAGLKMAGAPAEHFAKCYYNLSSTLGEKKDYRLALTYAFKALEIARSEQMSKSFISYCLTSVANNYDLLRNYAEAITYYQEAIAFIESFAGRDSPALLLRLNNLGIAYRETYRYKEADQCFDRALKIARVYYGEESPEAADCYMHIGLGAIQKKESREMVEKALAIYRKGCQTYCKDVARAYVQMARWWEKKGNSDSALFHYQTALYSAGDSLPAPEKVLAHPYLLEVLIGQSSVYRHIGQKEGSTVHLQKALQGYDLMDKVLTVNRQSFQREGSKLHFNGEYKQAYEEAISTAYALDSMSDQPKAMEYLLKFLEKSKAGVLMESVAGVEAYNRLGLPEAVAEEERKLRSSIARCQSRMDGTPEEEQALYQAELFQLSERQDSLLRYMQQNHPRYFRLKYQDQLPALEELQKFLAWEKAVLVEYFYGDTHLYRLSLTAHTSEVRKIAGAGHLNHDIGMYIQLLKKGFEYTHRQSDYENLTQLGHGLYTQLLGGLDLTEPDQKLIIIPDGTLALLPFETLLTTAQYPAAVNYKELPYLLWQNQVSYAYSASFLMQNSNKPLDLSAPLLAFGHTEDQAANALQSSVDEVLYLQDRFPTARAYWGETSSKSKFAGLQSEGGILHLALHNFNDTVQPYNSGLLFPAEDGEELLQLHELYAMQFEARLVVLSACESGTGRLYKGEGVYSMGRAFSYAGIPAVITSLWKVRDAKVPEIMQGFYEALYNGKPASQALTEARRSFIRQSDKFNAHPAYWGAFISIGDTLPIKNEGYTKWFWAGGILVFLLTGVMIYRLS